MADIGKGGGHMVDKTDWRRNGQESYLMNVKLYHLHFQPYSAKWEHEHCEFCWDKFGISEDDLHDGYCTTPQNSSGSYWICPECYHDFKDEFGWAVIEGKGENTEENMI